MQVSPPDPAAVLSDPSRLEALRAQVQINLATLKGLSREQVIVTRLDPVFGSSVSSRRSLGELDVTHDSASATQQELRPSSVMALSHAAFGSAAAHVDSKGRFWGMMPEVVSTS